MEAAYDETSAGASRDETQHHDMSSLPTQHPIHSTTSRDEDQLTGNSDPVSAIGDRGTRCLPYLSLPLAGYKSLHIQNGSSDAAARLPQHVQDLSSQQMSDYENPDEIIVKSVPDDVEVA